MLRKLICIIFATCIFYTVPAYGYIDQLENGLRMYVQDELNDKIQKECSDINAVQPNEIDVHVARMDERCAIIVDISGTDERIVSFVSEHIAYETYMILRRLGLSERTRQQINLMIAAIPINKDEADKWIFYDASVIYWEGGTNMKHKRFKGKQVYQILNLDRYYQKIPGETL